MQRIASAIISVYIATLIYGVAFFVKPLTLAKGSDQLFWNHLMIFVILLVPIYIVISDIIDIPKGRSMMGSIKYVLLVVALVGLVMSLLYHVILLEPIFNLPSVVDQLFASDVLFTVWLIAPLVVLFI